MDDEYVMYLIINQSLDMGKGKIAAQVGHVVQMIIEDLLKRNNVSTDDVDIYNKWRRSGMAKIVLKTNQQQMDELILLPKSRHVRDHGRTQVPANSLTAVGFLPCSKQHNYQFKDYKLL
jgi:peptidyl-tRNA hydrolase